MILTLTERKLFKNGNRKDDNGRTISKTDRYPSAQCGS